MKAAATSAIDSRGPAPERAGALRRHLGRWYRSNGRHALPWRLTRDPYAVLVSEVMLQQTQVERVVPYYVRWLERWPTVAALAGASPADAIREWAGLGYNRRAINLHRAAVLVLERHDGVVPRDPRALRQLPGVGAYTAGALASFAMDAPTPVVDTNIGRVLARAVLGTAGARGHPPAAIDAAARGLLPGRNSRDHNLALMDLGAMVCTAKAPSCGACPLRRHCAWLGAGMPAGAARAWAPVRFEATARYARGRIVDLLRDSDRLSIDAVRAALPESHRDRAAVYLHALERDGMVERLGDGRWALPGQGRMSIASPKL